MLEGSCDRVVVGEKFVSEVWARIGQNLQVSELSMVLSLELEYIWNYC